MSLNSDFVILILYLLSNQFFNLAKVVKLSKQLREFEMIKITDNLSWSQLEKIELNLLELPGVHLLPYNKRYYPQSHYFSHIVGYTSQPSEKDMELPYIVQCPH